MTKRKSKEPSGCISTPILIVLAFAMLLFKDALPKPSGGELVHPMILLAVIGGGVFMIIGILTNRLGFYHILLAALVAVLLMTANSFGVLPSGGENPCPGDEIVISINGNCYGMDADENADWVKSKLK